MGSLDEKYEEIKCFIHQKGSDGVVIAFSGGVDSSTLAMVSHGILQEKAVAVTAVSPTYPVEELEEAKKIAQKIGIKHILIETNELSFEEFVKNPEDRCYHCKKELLSQVIDFAQKIGFNAVFEGTNFSDLHGHRPGFKAVREEGVYSPWVVTRFTKEEIRAIAKKLHLPVHDKPSLACLASRIPFGERITAERLDRIEKAEQIVKNIVGVRQLRVRDHNDLARIELGRDERNLLFNLEVMDKLAGELKRLGFKYVTTDLEGYKMGSMLQT
jgi:uncharacterized protein